MPAGAGSSSASVPEGTQPGGAGAAPGRCRCPGGLGTARNSTARLGTGGMALGFNLSALPPLREYELERSFDEREALGWMRDNWWVSARRRGSSCGRAARLPACPQCAIVPPAAKETAASSLLAVTAGLLFELFLHWFLWGFLALPLRAHPYGSELSNEGPHQV